MFTKRASITKTTSVLVVAIARLSTGAEGRNLVLNQPRATGTTLSPGNGALPEPTPPPGSDDIQQAIYNRGTAGRPLRTIMIAPDNTCGWISASVAAPYTCGGRDATCGLVLGQESFVMCFNAEALNFRLGCVDYDSYFFSSACDSACQNTYTAKCTRSALPYCNTVVFPGGVTDYWCNSISGSTAHTAQTTWRGHSGRRSYSIVVESLSRYLGVTSMPTNTFNADPTATGPVIGAVTGGGSWISGDNSSRSNKPPIGAIVGAIVGGVAVIGIGLLALIFFLRRKKSRSAGKTGMTMANQSPMQPSVSTGMSTIQNQDSNQNQNQAGNGPKFVGPSPLQTNPPQQQYPQPTPPPQGGYYPPSSLSPSSPTASHVTDTRRSEMPVSPSPTWPNTYELPPSGQLLQPHQAGGFQPVPGRPHQQQPQPRPQGQQPPTYYPPPQAPVHEMPAQTSGDHRGQMQEMP
ncbi:hypothetical protein E4U54_001352 [Claviceps lovelessii]|nr:hypothetical protein E4U54_001352 [Claviceps lovelessii]